ncbi:MAG: phosphohistidine phosphatase SixA [Oleiphilaceae bacterium]|nr:phosphohistidine phosphatase SixA [Oleiphilaceae bacterium]
MINLFLCRHGEASFDAPSDRQRPLTDAGIAKTKETILRLSKMNMSVSDIWCSDLMRAQQTAQLFSSEYSLIVEEQTFLRPDSDPERATRKLNLLRDDQTLLIVAHMPLLGELVSLLTEGHPYTSYPFQTSELVHLRGEVIASGMCDIVPV